MTPRVHPEVNDSSAPLASSPLNPNHPITLRVNQMDHRDLATERGIKCLDEEYVKEFFGQLWTIPKPDNLHVLDPILVEAALCGFNEIW
jgi:hypothetical protein